MYVYVDWCKKKKSYSEIWFGLVTSENQLLDLSRVSIRLYYGRMFSAWDINSAIFFPVQPIREKWLTVRAGKEMYRIYIFSSNFFLRTSIWNANPIREQGKLSREIKVFFFFFFIKSRRKPGYSQFSSRDNCIARRNNIAPAALTRSRPHKQLS